jgi:two-component system LytT family response regulator
MSLRVVVLGQVPSALQQQLAELATAMDLQIGASVTEMSAARAALTAPVPDVAIIATQFTDGTGFGLLRAVPAAQRPVAVIVVGTKDEDAVAAFEMQATDFVLWPATPVRVQEAVSRARQQALQVALLRTADELKRLLGEATAAGGVDIGAIFSGRLAALGEAAPTDDSNGAARRRRGPGGAATGTLIATTPWRAAKGGEARLTRGRDGGEEAVLDLSREDGGRGGSELRPLRVLVREGRRTRFVPLADVDWFEADGNYIRVHAGGEHYRTRGTITAIESALDPRQFVRIHRRIVVNMDRVREMSPLPGGDGLLVLGDGSTLRLSRTYRSRVR